MTGRRYSGGPVRLLGCEEAVEAVSARLDGERVPVGERDLDAHLASCPSCREFEARIADLGRRVRLMPARPVPDHLVATLAPLLEPSAGSLPRALRQTLRRRFAPGTGPDWAGAAGWAGATLSVVLVAVALSFGVGQHPHLVPTRPVSPCTEGLPSHHLSTVSSHHAEGLPSRYFSG